MNMQPTHTLYVNNLSEKFHADDMKKALYAIFSQFGEILDITFSTTQKMRGQAFIAFKDLSSACTALRLLQLYHLFDKPMRIAFARKESDVVAKMKGTYKERPRGIYRNGESSSTDPLLGERKKREEPPNCVLFVSNLPKGCSKQFIKMLFDKYDGFKEVRLAPSRPDIAFVEYQDEHQSAIAKQALQGVKLFNVGPLNIEFAKK